MFIKILRVVFISSILFACQQSSTQPFKKPSTQQPALQEISFTATVKYINLEGGFFGLLTTEGQHWLPVNLKSEFKKNGTVVKIRGHEMKNMMSIQQWGKPFSITHIQLIKMNDKGTLTH